MSNAAEGRKLTHLDDNNQPRMVNVSHKTASHRTAMARCYVDVDAKLASHLKGRELHSPKGPVFHTAIIAGTMAAKKCGELIPFCHPIGLDACDLKIEFVSETRIQVVSTCEVFAKTGVEMEALTACSVAALTIYDMCKAFGVEMVINETRLIRKTGGKKDYHYE